MTSYTDHLDTQLEQAAYRLHQVADQIVERLAATGSELSDEEAELMHKAREYRARVEQPL
jgi:hypothetical protein